MQLAIIKDGVVQLLVTPLNVHLDEGQSAAVVPDGVEVKKHDLYSSGVFSPNPDAADILAAEAKKKEITATLSDVVGMNDLKDAILDINQALNG